MRQVAQVGSIHKGGRFAVGLAATLGCFALAACVPSHGELGEARIRVSNGCEAELRIGVSPGEQVFDSDLGGPFGRGDSTLGTSFLEVESWTVRAVDVEGRSVSTVVEYAGPSMTYELQRDECP
jgi:hypothetical protein